MKRADRPDNPSMRSSSRGVVAKTPCGCNAGRTAAKRHRSGRSSPEYRWGWRAANRTNARHCSGRQTELSDKQSIQGVGFDRHAMSAGTAAQSMEIAQSSARTEASIRRSYGAPRTSTRLIARDEWSVPFIDHGLFQTPRSPASPTHLRFQLTDMLQRVRVGARLWARRSCRDRATAVEFRDVSSVSRVGNLEPAPARERISTKYPDLGHDECDAVSHHRCASLQERLMIYASLGEHHASRKSH
jgi:hypothetical protein